MVNMNLYLIFFGHLKRRGEFPDGQAIGFGRLSSDSNSNICDC